MTYIEPDQIGVFILVAILVLIIFSYLVSLIAIIPPIREIAKQNKLLRAMLACTLGFVVCTVAFIAITRWVAETSFDTPPHGVASGIRDDFEHMQSGALFINDKTGEEWAWDDIALRYLSRERFLRYARPPFMRQHCFTDHVMACRWADIDLVNYDDKQEWMDFFLRLMISIGSGLATGFMVWMHIESKEALQMVQAG